MSPALQAPIRSLYAHVPFCAQKCSYCAFYSEPTSGDLVNRYVSALVKELELVAPGAQPEAIFFGGGTPSLLNLEQWKRILTAMDRLELLGAKEFTVECNPATVSLDKARFLRAFGVNRISMGVQSLDRNLLEKLGRVHSREMVFKSYDILRKAGFENVNLDLMFAIPGQTVEIWEHTLKEALALGTEHLSCYEVIYEEDTALYRQLQAGEFDTDEDLACTMYERLLEQTEANHFQQYEVANFARHEVGGSNSEPELPHYACRHNVNYWRGGACQGVGPSATSYINGVRSKNWSNTRLYCEELERGKLPVESNEILPGLARAGETAAFGLRMTAGWPFAEFQRITGFDLRKEWSADMDSIVADGWVTMSSERFQLTPAGLRFADSAAEKFLR